MTHSGEPFEIDILHRIGRLLRWGDPVRRVVPEPELFRALLAAYGGAPAERPVVKVAGTNGKGSVTTLLAAALAGDGRRVLAFTSPHLERVTERIRIGGQEIAAAELERLLDEVEPVLLRFVEERGWAYAPTYFQVLALAAWHAFVSGPVDCAVFEAGVGGATDIVSVLPEVLSVITSVSLDHQERIGPTLADIARNKAGIVRNGSVLVLGPHVPEFARREIACAVEPRGVRLLDARGVAVRVLAEAPSGFQAEVVVGARTLVVRIALGGEFQRDNLATTAAAIAELAERGVVASPDCLRGVAAARWPGRFEYVPGAPALLFDVAHNEESARALAASVRRYFGARLPVVIFGSTRGEDASPVVRAVAEVAAELHLTDGFYRAQRTERPAALPAAAVHVHASVEGAVEAASRRARDAGRALLVTGSVFVVGAARGVLRGRGYPLE